MQENELLESALFTEVWMPPHVGFRKALVGDFDATLAEIGVPLKARTILSRYGVDRLCHILPFTEENLMSLPGFGPVKTRMVTDALARCGHRLRRNEAV